MKILSQCALAGALLSVAQACATPVEISDDIQEIDPSSLGDSGVAGGGSGGSAGNGGTGQGGSVQGGAGGTGSGGSSGAGGQLGGAGGTSGGGAAGVSGAGGSLTGGAGGAAGTGGTGSGSVFDPEACDFENIAGCEELACAQACPTNMGNYCPDNCPLIVTCVSTDPMCVITEQDPLCAVRVGQSQTENACTAEVQSAGGVNPASATEPSAVARAFIECLCSVPRP